MTLWPDRERFDTSCETLCTSLRWKQQFIGVDHDPTVPPSNDGLFWCIHTQTCIGPDGQLAEPGWWAQYGLGPEAMLYLAPIPATVTQMEVDLSCIPMPLTNDDDPEPIPYPWTDAVSYFAAFMALLQQQRNQDAQLLLQLFTADLPVCAAVVAPQMLQTPYRSPGLC